MSRPTTTTTTTGEQGFVRGLNLFDATMVVIGAMIGSGIFIVSADMSRLIGSPGWMLVAWGVTGVLTITAALSYGELASMLPHAGGMYVYLREAFSPLWGFLYGWTLFTVIQTGTIAAVAVAFARFLAVVFPPVGENRYLVEPIHISSRYAISLSTAQLVGIAVIALLTWANSRGLEYGKMVQNLFTTAKTAALAALILAGLFLGWSASAVKVNFTGLFKLGAYDPALGVAAGSAFGLMVALCVAQSGSLFSADSWHDITFAAGEVRNPRRNLPLAMALGVTAVIGLYLLANVAYLVVLPLRAIQQAPADRVATAMLQAILPGYGPTLMAVAIMISTFGCVNSLVLAGARAYYAMAKDGLFFARAGVLNQAKVPGWSLMAQGIWSAALVLPRTYNPDHAHLRQPLQQLAGLCDFRSAVVLYSDHRGRVPAAADASGRGTAVPGGRLSLCAGALHFWRGRGAGHVVRLPSGHHLAGIGDRDHRGGRVRGVGAR
jgi:APA family basic amino acid/polyamine antiporter